MIDLNSLDELQEYWTKVNAEMCMKLDNLTRIENNNYTNKSLFVPFISQQGPGADKFNNDCGAACGCMVVKAFHPADQINPNEFYKLTGQKKDDYLGFDQIMGVLYNDFRIATNLEFGDKIIVNIKNNLLMIALINYGKIQDWTINPNSNFRGQHFVVASGYGLNYYKVLDPLAGVEMYVPINVFTDAWASATPSMGAIVTAAPIGTDIETITNYEIITPYGVNIRKSPDVSSEILGALQQGKVAQVYELTSKDKLGHYWGRIGKEKWIAIWYKKEKLANRIK